MKKATEKLPPENPNIIKKYVLHFDINKTIVLADLSQKKSKDEILHELLAGYAWGKMDEKYPDQWKLVHNQFTWNPPPGLISYKEYVETMIFVDKTEEEEPDEAIRKAINSENKEKRKDLYMHDFIKQGKAGIKLKPDYEKILKQLNLPRVVMEELKIPKDGGNKILLQNKEEEEENDGYNMEGEEKHPLFDLLIDGKYFILPNFFKLLLNLKKQKKEFSVIFRSFGTDVKNVVTEFNKFCIGEHPCYNGKYGTQLARFDGSKNTKNYIINEMQQATLYRTSPKIDDITSIFGTLNRLNDLNTVNEQFKNQIKDESIKILKGGTDLYIEINELLKESCAIAINDDYNFWNSNGEKDMFSKPLLIDQHDYSTLHVFFDDNIEENEDDCKIVDVRDVVTGEKIPIKKSLNKYIVRVETLRVIRESDYLSQMIDLCEKNRLEEIEKNEKGIIEEMLEEGAKTEWDLLQESSDYIYLRRTVFPLLHPVLKLIDIERPNDPISYIATYMLKNKKNVKIPEVTIKEEKIEEAEAENLKTEEKVES